LTPSWWFRAAKPWVLECIIGGPVLYNVFSVAKTFTVTGIGMAVDAGLLHPSDKLADCFKGLFSENTDPRWQNVTLEHLLTMTSGHGAALMMTVERNG
jgi:CubicO group peptidase (beta-lactamase class C family)